jgi:hypothetical protein
MLVHEMLVQPPHAGVGAGAELQHGIHGAQSGGQKPPLQQDDCWQCCGTLLQSGLVLLPVLLPEGQHGINGTQSCGQGPPLQQDSVQLYCCKCLKTVIPPRWQPAPKSEGQHAIRGTQSGGQKPPLQQESGHLYCCTRLQSAGELVPFPSPYAPFPCPAGACVLGMEPEEAGMEPEEVGMEPEEVGMEPEEVLLGMEPEEVGMEPEEVCAMTDCCASRMVRGATATRRNAYPCRVCILARSLVANDGGYFGGETPRSRLRGVLCTTVL